MYVPKRGFFASSILSHIRAIRKNGEGERLYWIWISNRTQDLCKKSESHQNTHYLAILFLSSFSQFRVKWCLGILLKFILHVAVIWEMKFKGLKLGRYWVGIFAAYAKTFEAITILLLSRSFLILFYNFDMVTFPSWHEVTPW